MHKIEVKHSSIVINDYNMGDCSFLENSFTIYDPITHTKYIYALEYDEDNKILYVPRGIDVYLLENSLNCVPYVHNSPDPYDSMGEVLIKYKPRDKYQVEGLEFMLGNGRYKNNSRKSQLSVNLPTGAGKSYCAIATMSILRLRSIVITSSLKWLQQWKDYILEYTNIKESEIIILSSNHSSIQLLLNRDINQYKVILASIDTIRAYGDKNGWDKVEELFKFMRVGLKFYDECHLNFETMAKIDYHSNTYKTYYITATPGRSGERENMIYQLYFKNVPSISLFDEEEHPHTHYISMRYKSEPTPQEKSACRGRFELDRNKYTNYIVTKPNFYKMLRVILDLALKVEGKCLIYIGTNKAIQIVKEWIEQEYFELRGDVGVYTSIIDDSIKDKQLEKKIILSTTKSFGAAMDLKGLKMTVVLAEPFKSNILAVQTLGRTRDNNTYYIEVVDMSFNSIYKYYNYKKPIYNKYALDTREINLNKNTLQEKYERLIANRTPSGVPIEENGLIKPYKRVKPE